MFRLVLTPSADVYSSSLIRLIHGKQKTSDDQIFVFTQNFWLWNKMQVISCRLFNYDSESDERKHLN